MADHRARVLYQYARDSCPISTLHNIIIIITTTAAAAATTTTTTTTTITIVKYKMVFWSGTGGSRKLSGALSRSS